jgi:hypothetical protein
VEVDGGGVDAFVAEPQGYGGQVDPGFEQGHGRAVSLMWPAT